MGEQIYVMEIEIKAHVQSPNDVLQFLKDNARFKKKYYKFDIYYAKGDDHAIENLLRLRKEKGARVFTAKKRAVVEGVEVNEESEMEMSKKQARRTLAFLKQLLGYKEYVCKEKKGRAFVYRDVLVELSEVKGLGYFVELELIGDAFDKDKHITLLKSVLSDLGLGEDNIEPKPYVTLLRERVL